MTCPGCRRENRPDARFCDGCGSPLAARTAGAGGARKVVSIVFADLIGSTALHERLDAESARGLMEHYYRVLRDVVAAHGGTVVKLLGDGVMAAFGVPRVGEDDAIRAVRAAVAMQDAFGALRREQPRLGDAVGLRVAVNTGEVVVAADDSDVVGDPVNVAARLQQEADDGAVVLGEATRRLVGDRVTLAPLGTITLKGRAETVAAHRVVSLEAPGGGAAMLFVGRDEELRRLRAVYDAARTAAAPRLAVVLGSPGLGKTRLLEEFATGVRDAAVVVAGRCEPVRGATFAPVADALRRALALGDGAPGAAVRAAIEAALPGADGERGRIANGIASLLAGSPPVPEETFFVLRRLLAALGAGRPVVLVVDDLQWAEPLLLDLLEHLVEWSAGVPICVLGAGRPELREVRAAFAMPGPLVADVVTLGGLDASAATRLAAGVIGAAALPAAVAGRVLATSEGNPLFVGELVRMLVQDGVLRRSGDHWTVDVEIAALEMPPTIHALLAARIERLGAGERAVLERAAVVGRQFSRAAVAALLDDGGGLDARLDALRRSELIEAYPGGFLGDAALRFHHTLIRDAAYRRLLKGTRAELHERFATWLEQRTAGAAEYDETIGRHLEEAHHYLHELGPLDARGRALGERAARALGDAGRRALGRDDLALAGTLLGRAVACLDEAAPVQAALVLDWCEAVLSAGDVAAGRDATAALARLAGGSARLGAWHACFAGQLAAFTDPQALRTRAGAVEEAAGVLSAAGDAAGEAKAHAVHAAVLARLGRIGECEGALDRALAAARRAQDRRRANAVLAGAPAAALWGPSPVTRASGRCLDVVRVLRITQGAPPVEAVALRCQAVLETLRGRADAARRMLASSRKLVEEMGITQRLLETDVAAGAIELIEGDAAAAERLLRPAYEGLRRHGLRIDAAQAAALLGRAVLAQDRVDEAEALSHESEALAGDDLKAAIAWRGVRAEAKARRGEAEAAVELARSAVTIAEATDALLDHADARSALAVALRAAGREADARAEAARASELWEAKGATLLADRAAPDGAGGVRQADDAARGRRAAASATPASAGRFVNAAARAQQRFEDRWHARDWAGVLASYAPGVQLDDRRSIVGLTLEGEPLVASLRVLFDVRGSRWSTALLATRGERLALLRARFDGQDDIGGPIDAEHLTLIELGPGGHVERMATFDLADLPAAYDDLERRFAAGEGAPFADLLATVRRFCDASTTRDWATVAGILPDDFALASRRRLVGTEAPIGRSQYLASRGVVDDLGLEGALRVDHVVHMAAGAMVLVSTWHGTLQGGAFEDQFVVRLGHDGVRIHRMTLFDVEQLDTAVAGDAQAPLAVVAPEYGRNAATHSTERFLRAWHERSWERFVAVFAPDFTYEDRRPMMVTTGGDLPRFLESLRPFFDMRLSRMTSRVLATRGDTLGLTHSLWAGDDDVTGPSEIEFLSLVEVDAAGRRVAQVTFPPDAEEEAYAELDARYLRDVAVPGEVMWAGGAVQHAVARDWDAVAANLAPDFAVRDHRPLGWGVLDAAQYVATLKSLVELAPDVRPRADHLTLGRDAALVTNTWVGTRDGGPFEDTRIVVVEMDDSGRSRSYDFYTVEQYAEARAHFDAVVARRTAGPPWPNAATASLQAFEVAWARRDWERLAALYAPGYRQEDRRPLVRLDLDRAAALASLRRVLALPASRFRMRVLATRGERLVLARWSFEGHDEVAGPSEVEWLAVAEVDPDGATCAEVLFGPTAEDAARAELDARHLAGEGAGAPDVAAAMQRFDRAFHARDWPALAAELAPGLVVHDHRLLGWESLHGPAAYVTALESIVELAPDTRFRLDHVTVSPRGYVAISTWVGTREGGPFETPSIVVVALDERRRMREFDQYDLGQRDLALARFAEVCRT